MSTRMKLKPARPLPKLAELVLRETIEKRWVHIAKGVPVYDGGLPECALCRTYPRRCSGCPILERTGLVGCLGTPYRDVQIHAGRSLANDPETMRHARRELAFLRRVLREGIAARGGEVSTRPKPVTPYARLLRQADRYRASVQYPETRTMFSPLDVSGGTSFRLGGVWERTLAADNLGWDVHLKADDNEKLRIVYVKRATSEW